jgi:hypothetical protein
MAISLERPFEARTTLTIDKANRLIALRAHPGFNDLVALSEQTVKLAEDALVGYEGWDRDELNARSIAFRAAKKSHEMLFGRMAHAIQEGIEEAAAVRDANATSGDPYSRDAADMADELRAKVLQHIDETRYDTRIPGTY